jgi:hypothetical protein
LDSEENRAEKKGDAVIKIKQLADAFPASGYDSNKSIAAMMAHAGFEYLQVVLMLDSYARSNDGRFLFNATLPNAHQALELFIKALVMFTDSSMTPKRIGHNTANAVTNYATVIPAFDAIAKDTAKLDLVRKLQEGYTAIRYAECTLECSGDDIKTIIAMAVDLADAFHDASGIPLLEKHFPKKP